jgi:hypothetical protein
VSGHRYEAGAAEDAIGWRTGVLLVCRDTQKPKLTVIASKPPAAISAADSPSVLCHDLRPIASVASSSGRDHANSGAASVAGDTIPVSPPPAPSSSYAAVPSTSAGSARHSP